MLNRLSCLVFFLLTASSAWASLEPESDAYDKAGQLTNDTITQFAYDPLGRRIIKHSAPVVPHHFDAGRQYRTVEAQRLSRERNLGTTFYGWDGNTLAWETTNEESTHYFYEPDSFVPLAQGVQNHAIQLHPTPNWSNREYSLKEDPLWTQVLQPEPFDKLGFYHCDHLGTPQEMTDESGKISWSADYSAWGERQHSLVLNSEEEAERRTDCAIRFQGQYFDAETGLHYNTFRYYDPGCGRFISPDPINIEGRLNLYQYAPNAANWIDPWGLDCHHIATNKNKSWSDRFRALFNKYGLGRFKNGKPRKDVLNDPLNKVEIPGHQGPHNDPRLDYHQHVHDRLEATGNFGGKQAVEAELKAIAQEATTPGSLLNKVLTKTP